MHIEELGEGEILVSHGFQTVQHGVHLFPLAFGPLPLSGFALPGYALDIVGDQSCSRMIFRVSAGRPWMNSAPRSTGSGHWGSYTVCTRPPRRLRASKSMTRKPAFVSLRAAARPAAPAPITRTSAMCCAMMESYAAPAMAGMDASL